MPHNQSNRVEALEKELPAGRAIYVWNNGGPEGESAIAAARAKSAPSDRIITVGWIKE